jgi:hypothetical protein
MRHRRGRGVHRRSVGVSVGGGYHVNKIYRPSTGGSKTGGTGRQNGRGKGILRHSYPTGQVSKGCMLSREQSINFVKLKRCSLEWQNAQKSVVLEVVWCFLEVFHTGQEGQKSRLRRGVRLTKGNCCRGWGGPTPTCLPVPLLCRGCRNWRRSPGSRPFGADSDRYTRAGSFVASKFPHDFPGRTGYRPPGRLQRQQRA